MLIKQWIREDFSHVPAAEMTELLEHLCASPSSMLLGDVYGTTTELISNVGQHAYPDYFKPQEAGTRYTLTVSEIESQKFSVTIQDYGVTIPASIFHRLAGNSISNVSPGASGNDGELLTIAINRGRTAPEAHRGTGLAKILDLVTNGSFDGVEIESRNGHLLYQNSQPVHALNRVEVTVGTKITVFFTILAQRESTSVDISVANDFSRYPAARMKIDGPNSGEAFRESVLVPNLKKYDQVFVDLDGARGYGSSFLEEAFGGLVRNNDFSEEELKNRMSLKSTNFSLEHEIWNYIAQSKKSK